MQRNVAIIKGVAHLTIEDMFRKEGWNIVSDIDDADLIQFCGGEDVSPHLYGEWTHKTTRDNPERDAREIEIYNKALSLGIPMVGICRGGQFLNVMNGGKMFQDVDGHAIPATHKAYIVGNLVEVDVTSTHHQMMRPNTSPEAECHILMTAGLSTRRSHMSEIESQTKYEITSHSIPNGNHKEDVEAVYYAATNCLCYQPHPEFERAEECRALYFKWIDTYLFDIPEDAE